jgi:hypothetical protein
MQNINEVTTECNKIDVSNYCKIEVKTALWLITNKLHLCDDVLETIVVNNLYDYLLNSKYDDCIQYRLPSIIMQYEFTNKIMKFRSLGIKYNLDLLRLAINYGSIEIVRDIIDNCELDGMRPITISSNNVEMLEYINTSIINTKKEIIYDKVDVQYLLWNNMSYRIPIKYGNMEAVKWLYNHDIECRSVIDYILWYKQVDMIKPCIELFGNIILNYNNIAFSNADIISYLIEHKLINIELLKKYIILPNYNNVDILILYKKYFPNLTVDYKRWIHNNNINNFNYSYEVFLKHYKIKKWLESKC